MRASRFLFGRWVLPALLLQPACSQKAVRPSEPPRREHAPQLAPKAGLSKAQRAKELTRDLDQLFSPDQHAALYARLNQRARDGEPAARIVLLTYAIRVALGDGCTTKSERQGFLQQIDTLESHLKEATPSEWTVAGATFLLGLHAAGRGADQPRFLDQVTQAAKDVYGAPEDRAILAEIFSESAHALRSACHLKLALPLLDQAVALYGALDPKGAPALLARRDLATIKYLLGDGASAQTGLAVLAADLNSTQAAAQGPERIEIVETLRAHLLTEERDPPPPPRETGPGWQALRTVQEEASCPEAAPGNARFLRVPRPPPACSLATAQEPTSR